MQKVYTIEKKKAPATVKPMLSPAEKKFLDLLAGNILKIIKNKKK